MSTDADPDVIDRLAERAPLLDRCAERFAERQPFSDRLIGVSAPLTPHTGRFLEVLAAGDATVLVAGEAGSTHADVVAALRRRPGVTPITVSGGAATAGDGEATADEAASLERARREVISAEPDLIADDGANLLVPLCREFPDVAEDVAGACEQTTGGTTRLRRLVRPDAEGKSVRIPFPVYDVNGAPMKQRFDNVHGTAESSIAAIANLTNAMIAGSTAAVIGYGHCGRGIARKLRSLGARTTVAEIDPRKALEAMADGHDVRPAAEAVADATFVIAATGRANVIGREQLAAMADGAVLASIGSETEIDRDALDALAADRTRIEPGVERIKFADGRTIRLLTEGRVVNLAAPGSAGNPVGVMDATFALMARGLEAIVDGEPTGTGLEPFPEAIDRAVAREKLAAMDARIDDGSGV
ncbi:adenosylhomocysteinase [Halopenitus malekzadehii]|uniref:Adenosylhomocysteinase n=1 Tax=Halopenitus malekzadehii TaxID=1267564 RepID=A0A1H6HP16_9EURY|nr:adenosylhomocysteinase [Halopenitus malekzadehii]SEH36822.1 adenosylhomocysteinase [Halopenitus malekzadehii]